MVKISICGALHGKKSPPAAHYIRRQFSRAAHYIVKYFSLAAHCIVKNFSLVRVRKSESEKGGGRGGGVRAILYSVRF